MTETTETFDYLIRTQFSFSTANEKLSCILNGIAEQKINVNAYMHTKENDIHSVRIIVGTCKSETPQDLQGVRRILRGLGLRFKERQVIQVIKLPAGKSGQLDDLFGSLWCELDIMSMYIGENTNVFLDASDIEKAIEILSQEELVLCPKDC